jgi:hypothetical protein
VTSVVILAGKDPQLLARIAAAAGTPVETRRLPSWDALPASVGDTPGTLLIAAPHLTDEGVVAALKHIAVHCASSRLVLVTSGDTQNLRALKDIVVDDVIYLTEISARAGPALAFAGRASMLHRLAARIECLRELDADVRRLLVAALSADPPFKLVSEAARAAFLSQATAARRWRSTFGGTPVLSLRRCLAVIRVLWLVGRARGHRGFTRHAIRAGVHVRTLERQAKRVAGRTLRQLATLETRALAGRLFGEWIRVLERFAGTSRL